MQSAIKEWGNSLAVRIPRALSEQLQLYADTPITLEIQGDKLILSRSAPTYHLQDLLDAISPENLHEAIETGAATGGEEEW